LILGESGTGKELVARAIYHYSRRSHGPFLAINCAAIPESLLESELFGHERGAFTGADRRRIGKFEQANGGTIFLDEIGDMSGATQAKVLRLLQDARFERVGDNQTVQTDVRVIAATNQDLEAMVAGGRFRRDLFYRLNAAVIELPPLRARMDDLPLLIEYFLADLRRKLGKTVQSIAPDALEQLQRHTWPGNVRELQNALKYAVIRAAGEVLRLECLPQSCRSNATPADADADAAIGSEPSPELAGLVRRLLQNGETDIYAKVLAEVDRVVLQEVLRHVNGNQGLASELLGMSRTTLRARLNSLGLTIAKQLLPESGRHG
jgi:two-component system nitrogen regulation response regulator GlnG